jgi:hypothetical protein
MGLAIPLACLFLIRFRYASPGAAFAAGALCACSPALLYFGTLALSEGPFSLLAVGAFWAIEATMGARGRARVLATALLAGTLIGLAGLCRTLGFVWIAPAALLFLLRQRWALAPFLIMSVPAAASWALWSWNAIPRGIDPVFYWYVDYGSWWRQANGPELANFVAKNLLWTLQTFVYEVVPGAVVLWLVLAGGFAWIWAPLSLFLARGAARFARAGRALPWLLAIYAIPVLLWPWPPDRFWVPLIPLCAGLMLGEIERLWRRRWPGRMRIALDLVLLAMILNTANLVIVRLAITRHHYPIGLPGTETPRWESLRDAFGWLRSNTPRDAVIAAALDPMVWLYSDRRAFRFYTQNPIAAFYDGPGAKIESASRMLAHMHAQGATFLLDTPLHNFAVGKEVRDRVATLASRRPPPIVPLFRSRDGTVVVYRIVPVRKRAASGPAAPTDRAGGGS